VGLLDGSAEGLEERRMGEGGSRGEGWLGREGVSGRSILWGGLGSWVGRLGTLL